MTELIFIVAFLSQATFSEAFGASIHLDPYWREVPILGRSEPRGRISRESTALDASIFRNPFGPKEEADKDKEPEPSFDLNSLKASTVPRSFQVEPSLIFDVAAASFPFLLRAGCGAFANGYKISISQKDGSAYSLLSLGNYQLNESCSPAIALDAERWPLIVYEFEACPFCRKVREAISILSLDVNYKPCPKESQRFRRKVKQTYGKKATFPFMIDPNTGVRMFESDDIVSYLFKTYSEEDVPSMLSKGPSTTVTCALGLLPRFGKGGKAKSSKPTPPQKLVLWAYESSPFCKLVREELCELQLDHVQISCPRGSPNRQKLFEKTGRFQVPYLEDANSGVELFETAAILEYLRKQYEVKPSPVKYI